jgi:hypothetical protein
MERRLLSSSRYTELSDAHVHLPKPAPQIIATALLALISCLRGGSLRTPNISASAIYTLKTEE